MKDPDPMFTRMRKFARIFPQHAVPLNAAADALEHANRWVLPGQPEPTEAQVDEIWGAYQAARSAMHAAHDAYKRHMMKECPIPC